MSENRELSFLGKETWVARKNILQLRVALKAADIFRS